MSDHREPGVLGIFAEVDATAHAIERLREAGNEDIVVFSPVPRHELEEALDRHESPVRMFTLVGGLTGAASGFALATWTSLDWPLVTGGKSIISIPAFVVPAFELMVLFGALSTVLGLLINARLPHVQKHVIYDPSFSGGHFGVFAPTPPGQEGLARSIMEESGALQIRVWPEEVTVD
jgi:hypothetical protein